MDELELHGLEGTFVCFNDERDWRGRGAPKDVCVSVTLAYDGEQSWGEFLTLEQLRALEGWVTALLDAEHERAEEERERREATELPGGGSVP